MRVYGSSPLYNYIELIFRSKRLFLVCIVMASLVTTIFVLRRNKEMVPAKAKVFLISTESNIGNAVNADKTRKGTIQFKLSVLSDCQAEDGFMKAALRDANLQGSRDAAAFDAYAKEATRALSFKRIGENILEMSIVWANADAPKIIDAYYSRYHQRVQDVEAASSTMQKKLLTDLAKMYADKKHALEIKNRNYLEKNALNPTPDPQVASSQYQQRVEDVRRLTADLSAAQAQYAVAKKNLDATPKNVDQSIRYQGVGSSSVYTSAETARDNAQDAFNKIKEKDTENSPLYKAAAKKLNDAQDHLDEVTKKGAASTKPGVVLNTTVAVNPQYAMRQDAAVNAESRMKAVETTLRNAQQALAEEKVKAIEAPRQAYAKMLESEKLPLYTGIYNRMDAEKEAATIAAETQKMQSATGMVYTPAVAEVEKASIKGFLLLAAGPIVGILIAFVFSLLFESLDHSLRTPMEVEQKMNQPVLAVLPRFNAKQGMGNVQIGSGDSARPTLPSS